MWSKMLCKGQAFCAARLNVELKAFIPRPGLHTKMFRAPPYVHTKMFRAPLTCIFKCYIRVQTQFSMHLYTNAKYSFLRRFWWRFFSMRVACYLRGHVACDHFRVHDPSIHPSIHSSSSSTSLRRNYIMEGRMEGWKEGRKEGRKEGSKHCPNNQKNH